MPSDALYMISDHLIVLQVVVPLSLAPLCLLLRQACVVWVVSLLASWGCFVISVLLLQQVLGAGEIVYSLGGWAAPWGIEYRLDRLNAFLLLIVTSLASIVVSFSYESVGKEIAAHNISLFYVMFLLHLAGLCGVLITGDAFNMFVFIEIASLSAYGMISAGRSRSALLAAYQYLIFGTVGATFILIAVGLLYAVTGTLNIADLASQLQAVDNSRTVVTALAFLTVGLCIKFGLFPLHHWLPNAYTYAPSVVSSFLAGTTSKVFIYVLLRFTFTLFGISYVFDWLSLDKVLMLFAVLAIFVGSFVAIYQDNIKRMLAYSSIAQIGYIILGVSLVSVNGVMAGVLHLFNHALIKVALFMGVACLFFRVGSDSLSDLKGVGRAMPWTMLAVLIGGLSLIGIPLTTGFVSKWFLLLAALEHSWWLAAVVVLASLLTMIYVYRMVEVLYFQVPESGAVAYKEAPLSMLLPVWVIILANVYFGSNALWTSEIARQIAVDLISAR